MSAKVIAIGLDSADPKLCNRWMDEGHLPNLAALRRRGAYAPLTSLRYAATEAGWTTVFSGVKPGKHGFWSQLRFNPANYGIDHPQCYDYREFPPFYALGPDYRVAAIDTPQVALAEGVNGYQLHGYGSHSQQTPRRSSPPDLLERMIAKYGDHPCWDKDNARLWQRSQLQTMTDRLIEGGKRRGKMCVDMLKEEDFDLFLAVFGEPHSAGHFLYQISEPDHPMYAATKDILGAGRNPMLDVHKVVDDALGEIMAVSPDDTTFLVFSQEGMIANNNDLPSMAFLPELMFRYSFPGKMGLEGGPPGTNEEPGPMIAKPSSFGWSRDVWSRKHDDNPLRRAIRRYLPHEVAYGAELVLGKPDGPDFPRKYRPYHWQAPMWWSRHWPDMKAFALTSFNEGYVRINLKGREQHGIVEREDYDRVCDEIVEHIAALKNARSGNLVAREVIRTRKSVDEPDARLHDGDIVVVWTEEPADVVDSPAFGRIGPIPHRRGGAHNEHCFAIAAGPGIPANVTLDPGEAVDMGPTILERLGAPIPGHFDGKPILERFPRPGERAVAAAE